MTSTFDTSAFGPLCAALIPDDRIPELGPGKPNLAAKPMLSTLTMESLFDGRAISDPSMAECCVSALWLFHDFLDVSHEISQAVDTPSGSYWHGIMHRREPDASNAKYWFIRARNHPVVGQLVEANVGFNTTLDFIDMCERFRGSGLKAEEALKRVQLLEWQFLFTWCWQHAVAPA